MTQVHAPANSLYLRAARALPNEKGGRARIELTSKQKMVARHLARDGFSYEEIREAMALDIHPATFRRKLKEINIQAPANPGSAAFHRRCK